MHHILTERITGSVFVVFLWITTMAGVPTKAEERAQALVQQFAKTALKAQTLSANIELTYTNSEGLHRNTGNLMLMKPNYALLSLKGDYPVETLASDGKSVFILADQTTYKQQKSDPRGANIDSPWFGLPFRYFFTQSLNPFGPGPDSAAKIQYSGEEIIQGETFQVLRVNGEKPMPYTARYYFGRDNIMRRSVVDFGTPPKQTSFTATLTGVRTNVKVTFADFQFKPPKDATLDKGFEDKMLALGKHAPDFTLPSFAGKKQSLAEIIKGKKAILINFWFLSCPPCRKEFPHFEKIYEQLKPNGLEIVAINMGDSPAPVADYVRQEHLAFAVLMGGKDDEKSVFRDYQVATYPTTYLFNSEGKLVYRATGFNLDPILKVLTSLGVTTTGRKPNPRS